MRQSNVSCGPGFIDGLATALGGRPSVLGLPALFFLGLGLSACGLDAQQGNCGPLLSSAECNIARSQLGTLDPHPPADVTNRFGRCVKDGTAECLLEDKAVKLGQRLFFDRCLSAPKTVACVTCHDPGVAFADGRNREVKTQPMMFMVNNMPVSMQLPLIDPLTPDSLTTQAGVQPRLDPTDTPLAKWDGQKWVGVMRRPQASFGSNAGGTGRHSPSLYNIAYGAVVQPQDGARTAGVIWAPWDGRYDSHWSLVADVLEFGATQGTDRGHIALRIFRKHKNEYEEMTGTQMPPGFDSVDLSGKYVYPRHGSPTLANRCWFDTPSKCMDPVSLPPTAQVRDDINGIFVNAGKALSSYMRRLRSGMSAYDLFMAGKTDAMNEAAQRGLRLFMGKAECIMCHNGPNFTDSRFHNLGVPSYDPEGRTAGSNLITNPPNAQDNCFAGLAPSTFCPDPGRNGWQARALGQCIKDSAPVGGASAACQRVDQPDSFMRFDAPMDCRGPYSDAANKDTQCLPPSAYPLSKCNYATDTACNADPQCQWADPSAPGQMPAQLPRCAAKSMPEELGQFKTPTLRNVSLTFPYMHNGALFDYGPSERGELPADDATPHLRRVVRFYNSGGGMPTIGTRDPQIRPLGLTDAEIEDVVEFLKALKDNSLAADPLSIMPNDLMDVSDCPM